MVATLTNLLTQNNIAKWGIILHRILVQSITCFCLYYKLFETEKAGPLDCAHNIHDPTRSINPIGFRI